LKCWLAEAIIKEQTNKLIALPPKGCVHTFMFALQMKVGIWLASKHLNFNLKCFCFNVLMSGIWFASKYLKSRASMGFASI
jgi:hypothetical protein